MSDLERLGETVLVRMDVYRLMDELQITGQIRDSMLMDPDRAKAVLEHARAAHSIRNPAAYANSLWRQGYDPRDRYVPPEELDDEGGPPSLSALEFAWSRPPSLVGEALMDLMAVAVARHGGFHAMQASFRQRDRYDADGELVERVED